MVFDEGLVQRIRELLGDTDVLEQRMFGGVGFLDHGNMAFGVLGEELIVRVGPAAHASALARPLVREFDITGRSMNGWVMVGPQACEADEDLRQWLERGLAFAGTLPPK